MDIMKALGYHIVTQLKKPTGVSDIPSSLTEYHSQNSSENIVYLFHLIIFTK